MTTLTNLTKGRPHSDGDNGETYEVTITLDTKETNDVIWILGYEPDESTEDATASLTFTFTKEKP